MMPSEYYSNCTTCIHSDDLEAIKEAIINLLTKEGGKQIDQLPNLILEVISDQLCGNKYWIVGLFPGKNNWTIIRTFFDRLLCTSVADKTRPKLSALAMQLGCDAFNFWVERGSVGILLEANAFGEIYISGCYPDVDVKTYYGQSINQLDLVDFSLLQVSKSLRAAIQTNQHPMIIEGERPDWLDEPPFGYDEPSVKAYGHKIDEALRYVIDDLGIWEHSSLLYAMDKYPDELLEAKGHLLYFQTPDNYKIPSDYKMTPEIWFKSFGEMPSADMMRNW